MGEMVFENKKIYLIEFIKPAECDPEDKYYRLYNSLISMCRLNAIKVIEFEP